MQDEYSSGTAAKSLHLIGSYTGKPVLLFDPVLTLDTEPGHRCGLTYKSGTSDGELVRVTLEANGWRESQYSDWNLLWSSGNPKPHVLQALEPYQKVKHCVIRDVSSYCLQINHFPRSYEITRKDRLAANVQRMQQVIASCPLCNSCLIAIEGSRLSPLRFLASHISFTGRDIGVSCGVCERKVCLDCETGRQIAWSGHLPHHAADASPGRRTVRAVASI